MKKWVLLTKEQVHTKVNHLTSKLPNGLRLRAKICRMFNVCPRHLQIEKKIEKEKLQETQEFIQKRIVLSPIGLLFQPHERLIRDIFFAGYSPKENCQDNNDYNPDHILEEFMEYNNRQFLRLCALMLIFLEVAFYAFYTIPPRLG